MTWSVYYLFILTEFDIDYVGSFVAVMIFSNQIEFAVI